MDFINCPRCGKVFRRLSVPICEDCVESEEKDFIRIKEFIADNPTSTLKEVAEGTDVSVKRLFKYLREGRLEIAGGLAGGEFTCEKCNKPIATGRICSKCHLEMTSKVSELFGKDKDEKPKDSPANSGGSRMYTYDKKKKD
ncbi:MAG: MerR family transcriptional regulator [Defluviitaleaceae bacterium]|nr:MerR family transcriptional regulator [Defluviitaleaceae bacterium]